MLDPYARQVAREVNRRIRLRQGDNSSPLETYDSYYSHQQTLQVSSEEQQHVNQGDLMILSSSPLSSSLPGHNLGALGVSDLFTYSFFIPNQRASSLPTAPSDLLDRAHSILRGTCSVQTKLKFNIRDIADAFGILSSLSDVDNAALPRVGTTEGGEQSKPNHIGKGDISGKSLPNPIESYTHLESVEYIEKFIDDLKASVENLGWSTDNLNIDSTRSSAVGESLSGTNPLRSRAKTRALFGSHKRVQCYPSAELEKAQSILHSLRALDVPPLMVDMGVLRQPDGRVYRWVGGLCREEGD